ncbi:MAG: hypothetical protein IKK11_08820 [Oscillospiraceae bacterium]|nr:hypothetical protein [Oscillospiraceae bacterium]
MNLQAKNFYVTIHFLPQYDKEFELVHGDIYKHIASGQLYKKRLLADHGWGQESGYVRFPEPTFKELIAILEYVPDRLKRKPLCFLSKELAELNYTYYSNVLGAVAVIMQDYVSELIDFLAEKVETKYFKNRYIRRHFREFSFDEQMARKRQQLGRTVGTKPYYRIFQEHDKWKVISHKVIKQVYKK